MRLKAKQLLTASMELKSSLYGGKDVKMGKHTEQAFLQPSYRRLATVYARRSDVKNLDVKIAVRCRM